jgi:2'-5' RNA ligase
MHQLIEPSEACRKLDHRIDSRPRAVGTGKQTFCAHCTLGYEMAITAFGGDEAKADEFVRDLRHRK